MPSEPILSSTKSSAVAYDQDRPVAVRTATSVVHLSDPPGNARARQALLKRRVSSPALVPPHGLHDRSLGTVTATMADSLKSRASTEAESSFQDHASISSSTRPKYQPRPPRYISDQTSWWRNMSDDEDVGYKSFDSKEAPLRSPLPSKDRPASATFTAGSIKSFESRSFTTEHESSLAFIESPQPARTRPRLEARVDPLISTKARTRFEQNLGDEDDDDDDLFDASYRRTNRDARADPIKGLGDLSGQTPKELRRRSTTSTGPPPSVSQSLPAIAPHARPPNHPSTGIWRCQVFLWAKTHRSATDKASTKRSISVRTPTFRDAPKPRKMVSKRESAQLLGTAVPAHKGKDVFRDNSTIESSFTYSASGPHSSTWDWKPAECCLNSNGLLTITTPHDTPKQERMTYHSIPLTFHKRSDISYLDPTFLIHPVGIRIDIRSTKPAEFHLADKEALRSPFFRPFTGIPFRPVKDADMSSPAQANRSIETDSFCYIAFTSVADQRALYTLLKTHAQPDFHFSDSLYRQPEADKASLRMWRGLELVLVEARLTSLPPSRKSNEGTITETPAMPTASNSPASDVKGKTTTAAGQFFCEMAVDDIVVCRTMGSKASTHPFWRDVFAFPDIRSLSSIQIRLYHAVERKGAVHIMFLGTADLPVQESPRNVFLEQMLPIFKPAGREPGMLGDLSVQFRLTELPVLPFTEYVPILPFLLDKPTPAFLHSVAGLMPNELETLAETLVRIYLAQDTIVDVLGDLIDDEIDGDESRASILFRGNTLTTKMVESFLRHVGTQQVGSAVGHCVHRMLEEEVMLEIDPAKLKGNDKVLKDNIAELKRWANLVWGALYTQRHTCPMVAHRLFNRILTLVESRYRPELAATMRYTAVSAFVFLRLLVPALLNPKLFGLTDVLPDPRCQRTLTLIAKILQGMANMTRFGAKESYMEPMNSFIDANEDAFVDFMSYVSSVPEDVPPTWPMDDFEGWEVPRAKVGLLLPGLAREAIPSLPFNLDLPKDLSSLVFQVARACETQVTVRMTDGQLVRFKEACLKIYRLIQTRLHALDPALVSPAAASPLAFVSSFRPSSRSSAHAIIEEEVATPSTSPRPTSKSQMPPFGRTRAQTVSASPAGKSGGLRRTPSGELPPLRYVGDEADDAVNGSMSRSSSFSSSADSGYTKTGVFIRPESSSGSEGHNTNLVMQAGTASAETRRRRGLFLRR